jgi:hypothetical protein
MNRQPHTPLKTEALWLLAVMLVAGVAGLIGLAVYIARLKQL